MSNALNTTNNPNGANMSHFDIVPNSYTAGLMTLTGEECDRLDELARYGVLGFAIRRAERLDGAESIPVHLYLKCSDSDKALLQKANLAPTGWYTLCPVCPFCCETEKEGHSC